MLIFGWNKRGIFFFKILDGFLKRQFGWMSQGVATHTHTHPATPSLTSHTHTHAALPRTHAHLWHQPFKDPPRHAEQGNDSSKQSGVREVPKCVRECVARAKWKFFPPWYVG